MNEMALWYTGLVIGAIFFVLGIIAFFRDRKNKDTAFVKMSLFEIVAAFSLIFPAELVAGERFSLLGVIRSVAVTLLMILKIFSGDGSETFIIDGHPFLSDIYVTMLALVNLSVMISIVGFVLQFLDVVFENMMFGKRKFEEVFLFTEMNEKTLSIAKSIRADKKYEGKQYGIVFLDVEATDKNKEKARELKAHFTNGEFHEELAALWKKTKKLDLYIFECSEDENLAKLNDFTKIKLPENMAFTRVFVELTDTPWSIYGNFAKVNDLPSDKVIVNLVHSSENFILNDLYDHSVFDGARIAEKSECERFADAKKGLGPAELRIVDVLIVGLNQKSTEMVRALLPLCQMPGFVLKITLISIRNGRAVLHRAIPELQDEICEFGESIYSIDFIQAKGYDTDELELLVSEHCPKFTFAFVATDKNVLNVNIGLRLNTLRTRLNNDSDYKIQICNDRTDLITNWMPALKENIELVGGFDTIYNYKFITMSKIYNVCEKLHNSRQEGKRKEAEAKGETYKVQAWADYCNDEYKRHSVYARSLALKYKAEVLERYGLGWDTLWNDETWVTYEHMRWNMYTRTLGYIYSGKTNVDEAALSQDGKMIAKVHACLIPFEDLPEKNKKQDRINLDEDIVKVLREET